MRIIPAIDIINGQCVRLSEGDYSTKKVYYTDPLEAALAFEKAGLKYLHMVDLDGAKKGEVVNWDILESIANHTNLQIDFSGGIKTKHQIEKCLEIGAKQVALGSIAVKSPEKVTAWLKEFGSERIIIGADVKDANIAINGWQQVSEKTINDYIQYYAAVGGKYFLCTDISKDGMLKGPATALYRDLMQRFPSIHLIASGGVSDMQDVAALATAGCGSAIIGKAIYEQKVSLQQLNEFVQ